MNTTERYLKRSTSIKKRFFPSIEFLSNNLIESPLNLSVQTKEPFFETSAVDILKLSDMTFSRLQLWTGRGLVAPHQLGRLLWLYRRVFIDEVNGQWKSADFYWREILRTLKKMHQKESIWASLNKQFKVKKNHQIDQLNSGHSNQLEYRIITELLIDTCSALFNGRIKKLESIKLNDRAFLYASTIKSLLLLADMEESECWSIEEPLADVLINIHHEQDKSQKAILVCKEMSQKYVEKWKYQDRLIELEVENVFSKLSNTDFSHLQDAKLLNKTIKSLNKIKKMYPNNPRVYEALGLLHQIRSVKLANGEKLSQALLEIEKSLAHTPGLSESIDIREQLQTSMRTLQTQMRQLEIQMASNSNASLNDEGQQLRKEANIGWSLTEKYIESGEIEHLYNELQQAYAIRLWHNIGLNENTEQDATSAKKLYESLPLLFVDNPETFEALKKQLEEVTDDIPEIDESGFKLVEKYFIKTFFPTDVPEDVAVSDSNDFSILETKEKKMFSNNEPAGMWLFSREGVGIKLLTSVVLITLLGSGAMAEADKYKRDIRDQAYIELLEGMSVDDEKKVLYASEQFLSSSGFQPDPRHEEVVDTYNKSFVIWFSTVNDPNETTVQKIINTYKKLVIDSGKGE